jgi:alpha/beta superfamily hydrolase
MRPPTISKTARRELVERVRQMTQEEAPISEVPMAEIFHRKFFLDGKAGRLEAMLWTAESDPAAVALVCHPHPLFGGTMHNKVVYQAAKALQGRGMPVLRFNFRGTSLSEGVHDKGNGEQDDVRVALDYLSSEFPGKPILVAGFSFGSWVSSRVGCGDARVVAMIVMGLPVNKTDTTYLQKCDKPKLFLWGSNDEFGSKENIDAMYASLHEPKELVIVEGVDHFFAGKLERVGEAINTWLDTFDGPLGEKVRAGTEDGG